jgi:predicted nucleic acid-binding protein
LSVVLDANLLIVLALDPRRATAVARLLREWQAQGEDLHAPALLRYEVASAIAQAVAVDQLPAARVVGTCELIDRVRLTLHPLADTARVVGIARRLERRSAYDAAYIALAEDLRTNLWTLDGRLARNAASRGACPSS